jgi:hypothetical protein
MTSIIDKILNNPFLTDYEECIVPGKGLISSLRWSPKMESMNYFSYFKGREFLLRNVE